MRGMLSVDELKTQLNAIIAAGGPAADQASALLDQINNASTPIQRLGAIRAVNVFLTQT